MRDRADSTLSSILREHLETENLLMGSDIPLPYASAYHQLAKRLILFGGRFVGRLPIAEQHEKE